MKKENHKQIYQLIRKTKRNFKEYMKTVPMKEPVAKLIKNDKTVQFFEDVKTGTFEFEKTNGEIGKIEIDPQFLLTFPIGKDIYRGYILYEDSAFPLPQKPLMYAEQYQASVQKIMNDKATYKRGMFSDKGEMWLKIFKGVAMILGAVIGLKLAGLVLGYDIPIPFLSTNEPEVIVQTISENATSVFK